MNYICAGAGVVLTAFGVLGIISSKKRLKNCTEITEAVITDYNEKERSDSDGCSSVTYYPVFGYSVGGIEYTEEYHSGYSSKPFEIGTEMKIKYDSNNPKSFILENENSVPSLLYIFPIVGIALFIIGFFVK